MPLTDKYPQRSVTVRNIRGNNSRMRSLRKAERGHRNLTGVRRRLSCQRNSVRTFRGECLSQWIQAQIKEDVDSHTERSLREDHRDAAALSIPTRTLLLCKSLKLTRPWHRFHNHAAIDPYLATLGSDIHFVARAIELLLPLAQTITRHMEKDLRCTADP